MVNRKESIPVIIIIFNVQVIVFLVVVLVIMLLQTNITLLQSTNLHEQTLDIYALDQYIILILFQP